MVRKVMFVAVIAIGAVLPFAVSAPGSTHQGESCFGSAATMTGSGIIDGTAGDDVIVGSDGNDSLHGKGGNDKICGGAGDDTLGGGPGDDQLDGGAGNDDIDGGPGADTIVGGDGDDTIRCGPDNDTADGGPGSNTAVTTGFEACETVTNANTNATPTETAPVPKTLTAKLTIGQETPRPKGTRGGTGLFSATLTPTGTGATVVWRLTFTNLSGAAVAAHIHRGVTGKAGPILVALCGPCRTGARGTVTVAGQPARNAILTGGAYVNVHTKKNPAGEIRGQIRRVDR